MTGVQLIGKDKVLQRFETFADADAWAIYQGKQFIVGGIGTDALDGWLTSFADTGSTATYMLRVFDSDDAPTSSTGNTDYIACLMFKVVDPYDGQGISGHNTKLMERIGALEKRLKEKDDDDEPEEDLGSVVMGWLSDPVKLNQVAGAVRQIFGTGGNAEMPTQLPVPAQSISGFGTSDKGDKLKRLADALDLLEKADPLLVEHLEKLASLSKSDPLIFSAVISKLDAL